MTRARRLRGVALAILCAACGGDSKSSDGDDSKPGSDAGPPGNGDTSEADAAPPAGDGDGDADAGDPPPDGNEGPGVHATGSLNGVPVQIDCAPPTDFSTGTQFIYQTPGGLFELWQFRCRTTDQTIAVWFDVADPVEGVTLTQPDAADKLDIKLGDPNDIQPLGRLSANVTEMTFTPTELDASTKHLHGTFKAAWSDDGSGKYGDIEGTIEVTGWE